MSDYKRLREYSDNLAMRQAPHDAATATKWRQELWEAELAAEDARPPNQAYNPYWMGAAVQVLNKFFGL